MGKAKIIHSKMFKDSKNGNSKERKTTFVSPIKSNDQKKILELA